MHVTGMASGKQQTLPRASLTCWCGEHWLTADNKSRIIMCMAHMLIFSKQLKTAS